jgi:predicted nucleic acid-binding protein
MRTPDALLAATALESEATGFVTNDAIFKRVSDFETLVLEELLSRPS